ncbi:MAG: MBL fold metallo-hydrolase [Labilithrix sp.]|nr:MBL fold metallo-hydrolase [Labilithrix sp.]
MSQPSRPREPEPPAGGERDRGRAADGEATALDGVGGPGAPGSARVEREAVAPRPRRWRRARIALRVASALLVVLLVLAFVSTDRFRGFGGGPSAATLARMRASPHFVDGQFVNQEPTEMMKAGQWAAAKQWASGDEMRTPTCPLPIVTDAAARLATPPATGLRVTWLGHSTTLIEIDGARILTDPNWSERSSPSRWVGPKRFHPPPLALEDLPRIDAVVVSHEHFDHLDMATVRALSAKGIPFHVPLGVSAHLAAWGVPANRIVEHDWWERASIAGGVEIVSTPSRHFNGRGVPFRVGTFWTSWAIVGPKHRVFFSGDTGLQEAFREIGAREGPFDVALLEIGQAHESWGDIHLGPLGALEAHARLGAKRLFPIHWATFQLAMHAWSEPAETLTVEAARRGVSLVTPRLGEPAEPTRDAPAAPWWRALPPIAAACP